MNFLDLEAHLVGPGLKPETVRLEQTAPGRYAAEFPVKEVGSYLVTVTRRGKTDEASAPTGVAVPYPPEYRDLKPNEYVLNQLAQVTGGRVDPKPEAVFGGKRAPARYPQDVWSLLVLLATLLWPLDVAARRLVIETQQISATAAWIQARVRRLWQVIAGAGRQTPAPDATVEQLLRGSRRRRSDTPRVAQQIEAAVSAEPDDRRQRRVDDSGSQAHGDERKAEKPTETERPAESGDALSRLRAAKRRARDELQR